MDFDGEYFNFQSSQAHLGMMGVKSQFLHQNK